MPSRYLLFGWHRGHAKGGWNDFLGQYDIIEQANTEGRRYARREAQRGAKVSWLVTDTIANQDVTDPNRQGFDGQIEVHFANRRTETLTLRSESVQWIGAWYLRYTNNVLVIHDGRGSGFTGNTGFIAIPSLTVDKIPLQTGMIPLDLASWPVDPLDIEFPPSPVVEPDDIMTPACTCNQNVGEHRHGAAGCQYFNCSCRHGEATSVAREQLFYRPQPALVPMSEQQRADWRRSNPTVDLEHYARTNQLRYPTVYQASTPV